VHPPLIRTLAFSPTGSSSQEPLRHPESATYRCFLPDLTGFIALCCTGPSLRHCLAEPVPEVKRPRMGIQPRFSGFRVQGTASSPPSTTPKSNPCFKRTLYLLLLICGIAGEICPHTRRIDPTDQAPALVRRAQSLLSLPARRDSQCVVWPLVARQSGLPPAILLA